MICRTLRVQGCDNDLRESGSVDKSLSLSQHLFLYHSYFIYKNKNDRLQACCYFLYQKVF